MDPQRTMTLVSRTAEKHVRLTVLKFILRSVHEKKYRDVIRDSFLKGAARQDDEFMKVLTRNSKDPLVFKALDDDEKMRDLLEDNDDYVAWRIDDDPEGVDLRDVSSDVLKLIDLSKFESQIAGMAQLPTNEIVLIVHALLRNRRDDVARDQDIAWKYFSDRQEFHNDFFLSLADLPRIKELIARGRPDAAGMMNLIDNRHLTSKELVAILDEITPTFIEKQLTGKKRLHEFRGICSFDF